MYIKFAIIIFSFLIGNTIAYTTTEPFIGFGLLAKMVIFFGFALTNCTSIQLLIAGKYQMKSFFIAGIFPTFGYLFAYLLLSKSTFLVYALLLYTFSMFLGIALLLFTILFSKNKESLVL